MYELLIKNLTKNNSKFEKMKNNDIFLLLFQKNISKKKEYKKIVFGKQHLFERYVEINKNHFFSISGDTRECSDFFG